MSRVVIFPYAKQAEAQAYADAVNTHYAANFEQGGAFTYAPRPDNEGQWVTAYYGDAVNGSPFVEPTECEAARADGVIHNFAVWPDLDES